MDTDIKPVPITGLAANFSPIPRIAPIAAEGKAPLSLVVTLPLSGVLWLGGNGVN